ncbi:dicarboxylate/amino acid:cation symporter [Sporolactobacillus terrae]|uniref:Dicarboxylate:amino acid:cation symporter DAACS family protein n=1 Tax=Sporolactobacillus terrae TaxID=269673 RepID=A0A5K7WZ21_9BACL|nr:dicarboxylate/amino acid:cation symporter [Sporolactobacillus terrae]BBN97878.1 dicarboxylate:amino acid:cation symporter DAACS family protein [Sporolactobacillus terrae]
MKKLSLGTKVTIGFVVGVILGLIFKEKIEIIKPLGDLFLSLIKMIVVPIVLFSIVSGITSLSDLTKLKRIGGKVILFYTFTTLCAALVGLFVANVLHPGSGLKIDALVTNASEYKAQAAKPVMQTILDMIPINPFSALVEGNLIQVIIFAVFVGVAMVVIGEKAAPMKRFFDSGTQVMYKVTDMVMKISPIGVAALIAVAVGDYGAKVFGPIASLIVTDYVGLILICFVFYALIIKFYVKMDLITFYKIVLMKIWPMTASTTSSSGTLPVTMSVVEKDFGVSKKLTGFSLPLGATINMDGAVNYYAIATIFVAQIYGVNFSFAEQLTILLLATLISIGSPGIPGGGIVMTIMLLTTMGLPVEIMGLIAGIYRILDTGHTTLNVTGDVVGTLAVAKSERLWSKSKEEDGELSTAKPV